MAALMRPLPRLWQEQVRAHLQGNTASELPFNPSGCRSIGTKARRPQARHSMPASSAASAILRVGGGQPQTGARFGFRFPSPTKDWLQTPTVAAPKNAAETMGYKFRTDLAESGASETNGLRETG